MVFSRTTAIIVVFLLITAVACASIGILMSVGPALMHGATVVSEDGKVHIVEHSAGVIKSLDPDNHFLLEEANGQVLQFQCSEKCLTALPHIRRHIDEQAHTDIYYVREARGILNAIDVD